MDSIILKLKKLPKDFQKIIFSNTSNLANEEFWKRRKDLEESVIFDILQMVNLICIKELTLEQFIEKLKKVLPSERANEIIIDAITTYIYPVERFLPQKVEPILKSLGANLELQ